MLGCNGGKLSPQAPAIEVGGAEQSAEPEPEPAPKPKPRPKTFEAFLSDFLRHLDDPSRDVVAHDLGVFAVTNAGAFPHLERFESYRALLESGQVPMFQDARLSCGDSAWITHPGSPPRFSCDTERYDVEGRCVQGSVDSGRLFNLVKAMTGAVFSEELGEMLQAHAARSEAAVTHYAFVAEQDLVLYFGQVHGKWRLVWLDAQTPCSA